MFDKKLWRNLDFIFVLFIFLLLTCSFIVMTSASMNIVEDNPYYYVKKQAVWVTIGVLVAAVLSTFNYKNLLRWSKQLYAVMVVLLVGVLFMPEQQGAHRWYDLKFMDFQPSELAKIITIICFAAFLVYKKDEIKTWKTFFMCFLVVGIPMGLVFIEPDLGTSLVFFAILLAMMWIAGIPKKRMLGLMAILLAIVAFIFWDLYVSTGGFEYMAEELVVPLPMKTYQLMRLVIFINPYMDPLNTGYHIIQSQVAIGSGGLFGKGFGQGSQIQNDFLPEHHTDFIFSVVGEEFGLIGCLVILLIFTVLIYRCLTIAFNSSDLFGTLIVTGISMMMTFQIFVNVGMTIGIMPITGLPLPFMSYGGTSMLINMIATGLILSVNIRSQKHIFI
ncbi:MAG: rod shape-determining protein RodA [Bacillota bacterium]|jgi:rod shape determining protein RodA